MSKFLTLLAVVLLAGSAWVRAADSDVPGGRGAAKSAAEKAEKKNVVKDEKKSEKKSRKQPAERLWPRGPEVDELKQAGLSDQEIAKAKELLAAVEKRNEDVQSNKEVAAAEAEAKKSDAALKAAKKKVDDFDLKEERKKAVYNAAPQDKKNAVAELLHYKPKTEKPAAKTEDKK